jgi:hypothetical protein
MKLSPSIFAGIALAIPFVGAMPSQAQSACSGGYSIAALGGLGSTGCIIGDKIYSDFSFSGAWAGTSSFTFSNSPADQHTFSGSGIALNSGTYGYTYKVTIAPGNPLQRIMAYRAGNGTSDIFLPLIASRTLTGTPGATVTAPNDGTSSPYMYPSPYVTGPVVFTSNISVTSGRMDIVTDTLGQVTVPGPLPIVGAAAAFGFSRKLRHRIKSTI